MGWALGVLRFTALRLGSCGFGFGVLGFERVVAGVFGHGFGNRIPGLWLGLVVHEPALCFTTCMAAAAQGTVPHLRFFRFGLWLDEQQI